MLPKLHVASVAVLFDRLNGLFVGLALELKSMRDTARHLDEENPVFHVTPKPSYFHKA